MNNVGIIFGGSGFVGTHLLRYLLDTDESNQIIIGDLNTPQIQDARVTYIKTDLRSPVDMVPYKAKIKGYDGVIIYNLAAICRIPGFPDRDYYETNILEAENVCTFANDIGCKDIVFTSSIAVYGTSEFEKTEATLPLADNPYGISKLVAEEIHKRWYASGADKNLHILRPGIIFGRGERANFTRLSQSIKRGYFFYPGRKDVRKAAVYVKDVARICHHYAESETGYNIYNLCYPVSHTIKTICDSLAKVTHARKPFIRIPGWLLLIPATLFNVLGKIIGKQVGINPDRVKKLMISTNISGRKLEASGILLKYPLEEAISDWLQDNAGKGLY